MDSIALMQATEPTQSLRASLVAQFLALCTGTRPTLITMCACKELKMKAGMNCSSSAGKTTKPGRPKILTSVLNAWRHGHANAFPVFNRLNSDGPDRCLNLWTDWRSSALIL